MGRRTGTNEGVARVDARGTILMIGIGWRCGSLILVRKIFVVTHHACSDQARSAHHVLLARTVTAYPAGRLTPRAWLATVATVQVPRNAVKGRPCRPGEGRAADDKLGEAGEGEDNPAVLGAMRR
jgi:hypothetical protein